MPLNWQINKMFSPRGTGDKKDTKSKINILSLKEPLENMVDQGDSEWTDSTFSQESTESDSRMTLTSDTFTISNHTLISSTSEAKLTNEIPLLPTTKPVLPPEEAVFSTEKITEAILSYLEPSDLLRCRLVSSSWLRLATNETLINSSLIPVTQNPEKNASQTTENDDGTSLPLPPKDLGRDVNDLMHLLDGMGSHIFPCSAFLIMDMTIPSNDYFKFFDRYGYLVKYLHIAFPIHDSKHEMVTYLKKSMIKFLTKLLTEQMPRLETLILEFVGMGISQPKFRGDIDPELFTNLKERLFFPAKQNQNLDTIEVKKGMPFEIIEIVCCMAPNVEKLFVEDFGFWVEYRHRLKLLKELKYDPLQEDSLRAMFTIWAKPSVKKLTIDFSSINSPSVEWHRQGKTLKRIFQKCCMSLEELHLGRTYFTHGTVLPRMPNVKVLSLISYPPDTSFASRRRCSLPQHMSQKISIDHHFPGLETIVIDETQSGYCGVLSALRLLNFCHDKKIETVTRIINFDSNLNKKFFQDIFPNAVVETMYIPEGV